MIGFNRRFDPNFAEAKRRLVAGDVGKIEMVTILSRDPGPPPVEYVKRSGGLFRDMMIHDLDMARFLLGEDPVEVHAVGSCLVGPAIGEAGDVDTAAVLLKTASGKIAQISNSRRASYGYDQRFEVHGAKGMVRAQNVPMTTVETADAQGFRADPVLPFFLERYAAAYRAELAAFLDAMVKGIEPSPSGIDGLKAQVLADAATESVQTGKPVRPVYDWTLDDRECVARRPFSCRAWHGAETGRDGPLLFRPHRCARNLDEGLPGLADGRGWHGREGIRAMIAEAFPAMP